jgi:chromosome segregation ATPase
VRNAGREIMGTGFVEEIGDPALSRAAEPYVERMQRTRANEEQIEKSDNRRRKLAAELETLNASRRTERRISELEEDLETLVTSRRAIRAELAAAVRDSGSAGIPAAVVSLFEQTTGLEDQLQKISAVSERIAAGIEVERLNRAVAQLDRDIQVRESRQAEIKSELSDLRKSKRATESKLEEQMAIRGSMDDLLSPELLENL